MGNGLLKLSGRQFFSNFENSKLIGVVLRTDFRQKPGTKRKLATSRGYSSQMGVSEKNPYRSLATYLGLTICIYRFELVHCPFKIVRRPYFHGFLADFNEKFFQGPKPLSGPFDHPLPSKLPPGRIFTDFWPILTKFFFGAPNPFLDLLTTPSLQNCPPAIFSLIFGRF